MKKIFLTLLVAPVLACSLSTRADSDFTSPGFWSTPVIRGYGKVHLLPDAALQPDRQQTYNIVFSLTQKPDKPEDINPSLDRVARTVNLYAASGVPLAHLHFVAVAYGAATPLAINNRAYKERFGTDNPNLPLIKLLEKAGVKIDVCGQAVAEHKFRYTDVDQSVTVALSGLTTVTILESKGYVLMPL